MRCSIWPFVLACFVACDAKSQLDTDRRFSAKNTYDVFALYSNDSSHIVLGNGDDRRIAGVGIGYSRRLLGNRALEWAWEAEIRPLNFIQEPWADTAITLSGPSVISVGVPGNSSQQTPSNCASATSTLVFAQPGPVANPVTETITQHCYRKWTYAGGISPLGQRVSFLKDHRLQPYALGNAGFLVSPRDVPAVNSSRFNFTFEFGAGIELFRDHKHSWSLDYRLHHLSNNYIGYINPGIDSQVFRLSYRVGR